MFGLPTFISTAIALVLALALGPTLARIAASWFTGQRVTHTLVEVRGMLLSLLLTPLLAQTLNWSVTTAIGVSIGISQGIAVARWGTRRSGGWSPALLGTLSLGGSGASWRSQQSLARGAVISCLATTMLQVVVLEALLTLGQWPGLIPHRSLGAELVRGSTSVIPFVVLAITFSTFLLELWMGVLLQRRVKIRK